MEYVATVPVELAPQVQSVRIVVDSRIDLIFRLVQCQKLTTTVETTTVSETTTAAQTTTIATTTMESTAPESTTKATSTTIASTTKGQGTVFKAITLL